MLKRKMLRDIRENMISYVACIVIIAVGLMAYVSMGNLKNILSSAKDKYYSDYKFSDIFAEVVSMPAGRIDGLKSIKGINEAEGKLVKDVRVLFRGREENVSMRLVSIDHEKKNRMNDVWILDGILPSKGSQGIALGSEFFKENGLGLGQDINVIINGRNVNLKITGIGQSPEYIYAMKNISDFLPSGKDFTVAYIPYNVMENLFQANGSINSIAFMLEDGYTFDDVKDSIEKQLEPYTLLSLVDKEDQMSNFMLSQEMNQLDTTATAIPLLFLSISSVILWIMLKRLVEQQRTQIGMLKACGYKTGEILWHYMTYALFIGISGGIAGGLLGYLLSGYMANIYQQFFTLPGLENEFSMQYFIFGILLAAFFSILAGFIGARSVMKLEPAEAMHPPAPPSGKKVFAEEIGLLWKNLTVQGKMAVRNIFRSKGRSLFTCIGVAFAFSLMAALFSFLDMFDVMILDQFKYMT
jgi:putative ABC transport system permease protein